MTVRRLLVANRGEIARRVFRTCRDLGIETVAVFSEADADLPFVAEADVAVRLVGSTPSETYLRGDLVLEAALRTGADAVHPGYGFLSENAGFARRVVEAGLTWVGPRPESIEQMGSKVGAKKLMTDAGVPVLAEVDPATVTADDLPLLVKASAGGGGRGMRIVRTLEEVSGAVEQAAAEAASAFGDATVFCEPFVQHGRHVEVQVYGDANRNISVLGERDCSIQRRHQKIVEESPAPLLDPTVRNQMHDAARAAAEAIGYLGVGTVEFLHDEESGRFWFLEMNTRLQVEHTVTECVSGGLDLVALQIEAAEGGHAATYHEPHGHAVEVRLYAEDPSADWQPQSGRLTRFEIPGVGAEFARPAAYGIRLDSGFEAGDEVGTHYEAMLAKVVAWAPTREQALRRLAGVLAKAQIHGVRTNRDLLVEVLRHPAFVAADVSTDFFERHDLAALTAGATDAEAVRLSTFAAAVALAEHEKATRTVQRRTPVAWRNVTSVPQVTRFVLGSATASAATTADESAIEVRWYGGRDGYRSADHEGVHVFEATPRRVILTELSEGVNARTGTGSDNSGATRVFEVYVDAGPGGLVDVESSLGHVALTKVPRFVDPAHQVATGSLLAPMPGTVVSVAVGANSRVTAGQTILVLEAMKMQHTVSAPHDGVVTDLPVSAGDQVAAGTVLTVVSTASTTEPGSTSQGESE